MKTARTSRQFALHELWLPACNQVAISGSARIVHRRWNL